MPLVRNGAIADDEWVAVADDADLPDEAKVLVSIERWRRERQSLLRQNLDLGVRLKNSDDVLEIAPDLDRLGLIALEFPKFSDGRAYSQARRLRERLGFKGELRATGNVLQDQLLFMQRCGFDAFEINRPDAAEAFRNGIKAFSIFFQPVGKDGAHNVIEARQAK